MCESLTSLEGPENEVHEYLSEVMKTSWRIMLYAENVFLYVPS